MNARGRTQFAPTNEWGNVNRILFVRYSLNFAFGEYISPSPLVSELPDALRADMRTGFCCARRARRARFDERVAPPTNEKSNPVGLLRSLEAPPGIGPGMKVLQTSALPLGYGAVFSWKTGRELLLFHISST